MRNFKKFLSLVMATLMILSVAVITTGAADTTADYTDAAQHLVALKIMKGDNGNLMLDQGVTRYQAALFFVQTVSGETDAAVWNAQKTSAYFKDVVEYGTAIDYAYGRKLVVGRGNGIFGYNDPITYQDMLVLAVRALGYETEDMSYPYGYILAAQKLGLTDDVAKTVNYTAPLTRGATAQIMWNMLNTEIAVVDPLTDKILYPGEKGLTSALVKEEIERVTLLEDAGYASGKIEGVITEFVEAENDDEVDTVVVDSEVGTLTLAAADLGITAKTPKVGYLGLPVTLLVDVAAEDFEAKYSTDADESKAAVVYAEFKTFTTVENLGNAGNIKATEDALTLGGTKFTAKNTVVAVATFTEDGWAFSNTAADAFFDAFVYDSKDGYDNATNSNGKVQYYVEEDVTIDDKGTDDTKDDVVADVVVALYTPYEFGQYFTRTLRYQTTSKDAAFTTIGEYNATAYTNFDGDSTNFVEYLVGAQTKSAAKVSESTTSVSKNQGAKAMAVTLEGESVKSGDFVFYSYNAVDNILTVAQNNGAFKEGRLTGANSKNSTVKIDGANKTVGFKGAFTGELADKLAAFDVTEFTAALTAGKNNVKYIEADGNVVYMEVVDGSSSSDGAIFDYAVVTVDEETMADLLGLTVSKYNASLTSGLYIDDNGYVAIAVLDKATGNWKLASLKNFHYGAFDAEDEVFETNKDVATLAKYEDMIGASYKDHDALVDIKDALTGAAIFLVVDEKNGVYDLAGNTTGVDIYTNSYLTFGTEAVASNKALTFSDTSVKTNMLTTDNDVDAARVSLTSDTVIVLVDGTTVAVRTGVQKASRSVSFDKVKVLSANSSLILMDITGAKTTFKNDEIKKLADWGKSVGASADATYYVALADVDVDINIADDETYDVTVANLFDLRTLKKVDAVTVNVETYKDADAFNKVVGGDLLYLNDNGVLAAEGVLSVAEAAKKLADDENVKVVDLTGMNFVDGESIGLADPKVSADDVTKINIKVVTLDVTGIDTKAYDYENAILADPASKEAQDTYKDVALMQEFKKSADSYFFYALAADEVVDVVEPAAGVFDNFVNEFAGKTVIVPAADVEYGDYDDLADFKAKTKAEVDYYEIAVELTATATYSNGALEMTVYKIVK